MAARGASAKKIPANGQIRLSQVVSTFGPGSMVDLPKHSVLIAGLDFWVKRGPTIDEPRLAETAARLLQVSTVELSTPPPEDEEASLPVPQIPAFQFPEWFLTQDLEPPLLSKGKTRLLVHRKGLTRGRYVDGKKKRKVVPVRWVRACRRGHIGDIDWVAFVHGAPQCPKNARQLYLDERGTSGDLSTIFVRCECGEEQSVITATNYKARSLGRCDGYRPWLGPAAAEQCDEPNRLLIRAASNSYFNQALSVISLPERDNTVREAVSAVWNYLQVVKDEATLALMLGIEEVKRALEGISPAEILTAIEGRRNPVASIPKPVKQAELETLIAADDEMGYDTPEGNFYARALPDAAWASDPWMKPIERVVLVHRLREVVAQIGFTRFESASPDINGDLDLGVERAALSRDVQSLPSYENRGEGVFLQFSVAEVAAWQERVLVGQRATQLKRGFDLWEKEHTKSSRVLPPLAYWALHSFSHLLLTAISLECGYPASSLRERVYAISGVGYGVLIYTGTSDAEGTLGGLIEVGRRISSIVRSALEFGLLCSNDPVCAQHSPQSDYERRFLHGAACHGCLLIAETSCEQQNDFLDRALVIPTVQDGASALFPAL
jgi:hypothetical protein